MRRGRQRRRPRGGAVAGPPATPRCRVITPTENLGFARAVNTGRRLPHRVATCSCSTPTPPWSTAPSQRLVRFADDHPGHGLYAGRTVDADGAPRPPLVLGRSRPCGARSASASGLSSAFKGSPTFDPESLGRWRRDTVRAGRRRDRAACAWCPASTWQGLGGYDERFFVYGEDVDLGLRARAAGLPAAPVPGRHRGARGRALVGLACGQARAAAPRQGVADRQALEPPGRAVGRGAAAARRGPAGRSAAATRGPSCTAGGPSGCTATRSAARDGPAARAGPPPVAVVADRPSPGGRAPPAARGAGLRAERRRRRRPSRSGSTSAAGPRRRLRDRAVRAPRSCWPPASTRPGSCGAAARHRSTSPSCCGRHPAPTWRCRASTWPVPSLHVAGPPPHRDHPVPGRGRRRSRLEGSTRRSGQRDRRGRRRRHRRQPAPRPARPRRPRRRRHRRQRPASGVVVRGNVHRPRHAHAREHRPRRLPAGDERRPTSWSSDNLLYDCPAQTLLVKSDLGPDRRRARGPQRPPRLHARAPTPARPT